MALNVGATSIYSKPSSPALPKKKNHNNTHLFVKLYSSLSSPQLCSNSLKASAQSKGLGGGGGGGGEITEEESAGYISSSRSQLDLLEQLTSTSSSTDGYASEGEYFRPTIREQLLRLVGDREGEDFSIPLGKNLPKVSKNLLTISQKRNIKRQAYLNDVSKRSDTVFFATIAAFVILPPFLVLGVAVITGYVQLLP